MENKIRFLENFFTSGLDGFRYEVIKNGVVKIITISGRLGVTDGLCSNELKFKFILYYFDKYNSNNFELTTDMDISNEYKEINLNNFRF